MELNVIGMNSKKASYILANLGCNDKAKILSDIAKNLILKTNDILIANKKDIDNAVKNGMKSSLIDRLTLTSNRIQAIADSVLKIALLDDPIGEVVSMVKRPNGLVIGKKRVPLGVVGIIYEARPNVTVDAAALCIKSGNAVILKGGSDAINSNIELVKIIKNSINELGFDSDFVSLIEDTSRETALKMMKLNDYIDVLIPRGGSGLIKSVVNNATVPVIETGTGNCHIFVDESADIKMAVDILINGKTQRTGVCNALESMLVHHNISDKFIPVAVKALKEKNVEIRGCDECVKICEDIIPATEDDYATEFLDLILSVKIVPDIDCAIEHINKYSTHHSEVIVTSDYSNANKFLDKVDSAAVYVNASTRFTDGGEFGFGAEMGISTQKLHARGPVGLKEMTTFKYIIYGNGQIRG